ncbi:hypothetical protein G6O67_000683 [Ophiocordyceps sinensis]|uniref:Uncharacterized protein n=1 Tax=Ophiocordyceps sinensis TaxID=72228 RepID=A0A8H4VA81_9HYPO|nr:hypothetical protein G6O67_000683 [Ophiocordyceps sinensis]
MISTVSSALIPPLPKFDSLSPSLPRPADPLASGLPSPPPGGVSLSFRGQPTLYHCRHDQVPWTREYTKSLTKVREELGTSRDFGYWFSQATNRIRDVLSTWAYLEPFPLPLSFQLSG